MDQSLVAFSDASTLYGNIIKIKALESHEAEITLDVVNETMLDYDMSLLKQETNFFTPYFYFFTFITKDSLFIDELEKLMKQGKTIQISLSKINNNNCGTLVYIDRKNKISQDYYFEFLDVECKLSEYNSLIDKLLKQKQVVNDKNKNEILTSIFNFGIISKINFSVYHVGYGHASYFIFNKNSKGFYDIGFTKFITEDSSVPAYSISNHKPKWVILSHWDIDHYSGVVNYKPLNCFSIPWIAPDEYSKHFAFNRIVGLLNFYGGSLYLVDRSFTGYNYLNYFYLLKGIGKQANNSGLFIAINNQYKMMSLGDLDYKYLPKDLPFYDVDYLVIPHHGSFQSGICPFKTHDIEAQAIVPVGFNNYENPSRIMLNVLQNRGFKIHDTYQDKSFYGFL